MSGLPGRRYALPTRAELRSASPWVWALLVLAFAVFAHNVIIGTGQATSIAMALVTAGPIIVAAALVFVAPQDVLIRIAAFGFAASPIFLFLSDTVVKLSASSSATDDYALLSGDITDVTNAFAQFSWVLPLVAVVALTVYVGITQSRTGRLIVAASVVLAIATGVFQVSQSLPGVSLDSSEGGVSLTDIGLSLLALTIVVAWGFFAAVTFERRMYLLATAAATQLASYFIYLLMSTILISFSSAEDFTAVNFVFGLLGLLFAIAFVLGVLHELPRDTGTTDLARDVTSKPEVAGAGQ